MEKRVRDAVANGINQTLRDLGLGKGERREVRGLLKRHLGKDSHSELYRYALLPEPDGGQCEVVLLEPADEEALRERGVRYSTLGKLADASREAVERGREQSRRPVGTLH